MKTLSGFNQSCQDRKATQIGVWVLPVFLASLLLVANIPLIAWGDECPEGYASYIVVAGDTMVGIAEHLGIDEDTLVASNPDIADPNKIAVGNTLCYPVSIPASQDTSAPQVPRTPDSTNQIVPSISAQSIPASPTEQSTPNSMSSIIVAPSLSIPPTNNSSANTSQSVPAWLLIWLTLLSVASMVSIVLLCRLLVHATWFRQKPMHSASAVRLESQMNMDTNSSRITPVDINPISHNRTSSSLDNPSTEPHFSTTGTTKTSDTRRANNEVPPQDGSKEFLRADKEILSEHLETNVVCAGYACCIGPPHLLGNPPGPLQDAALVRSTDKLSITVVADGVSGPPDQSQNDKLVTQRLAKEAVMLAWDLSSKRQSYSFLANWSVTCKPFFDQINTGLKQELQQWNSSPSHPINAFTTLALALCQPDQNNYLCCWLAVGDSSIGIIRSDGIKWLTPHDAKYSGTKSNETDALPDPARPVSFGTLALTPGEAVFACTDGAARVLHADIQGLALTRIVTASTTGAEVLGKYLDRLVEDCANRSYDDASLAVSVFK